MLVEQWADKSCFRGSFHYSSISMGAEKRSRTGVAVGVKFSVGWNSILRNHVKWWSGSSFQEEKNESRKPSGLINFWCFLYFLRHPPASDFSSSLVDFYGRAFYLRIYYSCCYFEATWKRRREKWIGISSRTLFGKSFNEKYSLSQKKLIMLKIFIIRFVEFIVRQLRHLGVDNVVRFY